MIAKRTTAACISAATALIAVAAASPAAPKQRMDVTAQKGSPTHFAGVPPEGVKASTPHLAEVSSSGEATVVPGGARRPDTGYVQQRLTLWGVQLLRSKILATGLFEHDLRLEVGGRKWLDYQARRGDRLVTVRGLPSAAPTATPAQTRELAWIEKLVAHPARLLPANVWADRRFGRSCRLATCSLSIEITPISQAASSSPQGARRVQEAQAPRVPDPDDGASTGAPPHVRGGWDIGLGKQCVDYRIQPRRAANPLGPPRDPCPSGHSLLKPVSQHPSADPWRRSGFG